VDSQPRAERSIAAGKRRDGPTCGLVDAAGGEEKPDAADAGCSWLEIAVRRFASITAKPSAVGARLQRNSVAELSGP